jgi:hypothetical protein
MPEFWSKMTDRRERCAFFAALAFTLAIGAVWFSFSFRSVSVATPVAEPTVEATQAGPLSRIWDNIADTAVSAAAQLAKIRDLWGSWSLSKPIEFERQE